MNEGRELSRRFFDALFRLKKQTHRKSDELRSLELHTGEYVALKTIYRLRTVENEDSIGVKTSDIGNCLFMKKPATSKMLNSLEDKGYINRFSNRRDRRVTYIDLTAKGIDLLEKHHKQMTEYGNQIIEKMGKEDVEELIRLLNKLSDIIEEEK
ncbi:MarR family winged helix-turn-helix transcriptional regulator [Intestinibacter sp.]|uniref:MarR family winged helix-turn-helix transcriptional regulator n=1 Tax=Intestinibacter sp. TaxID=1965304 RepID=UPI003F13B234